MSKFDGLLSVKTKQDTKKRIKTAQDPVSEQKNDKLKSVGKRSDPAFTQITAYVRRDTHENVMRRIYKRKEFSELIEELLRQWLTEND